MLNEKGPLGFQAVFVVDSVPAIVVWRQTCALDNTCSVNYESSTLRREVI